MNDCLFCKIINGEIPSKKIYEDDKVLVFMDINPNTNGDLLLIPKNHFVTVEDIDIETISYMYEIIKEKIVPLLKNKLKVDGITLSQNNGLGQEIKHFHIHITPRYKDDNLKISTNKDILKDLDTIFEELTN